MKKYDKAMIETAFIWSKESYCRRKKVGAVIAKEGRIISIGYNGTISGFDNCCEDIESYQQEFITISHDFKSKIDLLKKIIEDLKYPVETKNIKVDGVFEKAELLKISM